LDNQQSHKLSRPIHDEVLGRQRCLPADERTEEVKYVSVAKTDSDIGPVKLFVSA
jgi:hypothetical protein